MNPFGRKHARRVLPAGALHYDYGTIAVTSLEYALSLLDEFTAVTT